jgi:tetratricopeptide (TPR) repeat protein
MKPAVTGVPVALAIALSLTAPAGALGQATPNAATIPATSSSARGVEHLRKGEQLLDNVRTAEAEKEFAQALKLDPNFVLAHAYHGLLTPGDEGLKEVEKAVSAAGKLPEAERTLIEATSAARHGDLVKANTAYARLTALVPLDWRAHYIRALELVTTEQHAQALRELQTASTLNPKAGVVQNLLGYEALQQGDANGAILALERYVRLMPTEPNAEDSLGEALLAAGRFADAEAAFRKALALSPAFWQANEGIAYAKLYAGDVQGGREALDAARAAASDADARFTLDLERAAVPWSQRDYKGALEILDTMEKSNSDPTLVASVRVYRAALLNEAGRYQEALAASAAALALADDARVPSGIAGNIRRGALIARASAQAGLQDVPALAKTAAALDDAAKAAPQIPAAQSAMHHGRGLLSFARGDAAAARREFDQCSNEDEVCKYHGIRAAEKAGDIAGATRAREKLLKIYRRNPIHLVNDARLRTHK